MPLVFFLAGMFFAFALGFAWEAGARSRGTINQKLDTMEERLMALSDEVKAFAEGVSAKVDAAVADIQALHAKLDEALNAGDVEGARAAIAAANEKLAALQAAVDVPE